MVDCQISNDARNKWFLQDSHWNEPNTIYEEKKEIYTNLYDKTNKLIVTVKELSNW